jgi:putative transposase
LYYEAKAIDIDDVSLLNEIRDVWEQYSFYGYRRITRELKGKGIHVNKKRVQRLMRHAGIQAIHPKPKTSIKNKAHATYPYLLKDMQITKPNQVWMVDITYLRFGKGFVYLVALIDVYSRYIVGWQISITLEAYFCVDALKQGLSLAIPDVVNSDQGSQFTGTEWVDFLNEKNIKISMTGQGRCLDNVFIERFWRSLKQEEFYLNDYGSVKELKAAIWNYINFYNNKRWHQSLDYKRPSEVYFGGLNKKFTVDMWTSPSEQSVPFGTCGQVMDNAGALPTT